MEHTQRLKFVIVGDKGVGKRTLLTYGFAKPSRLSPFYIPIEFVEVELSRNSKTYQISCYDSLVSASSVPRTEASVVETLTAQAVGGADAVLLCYAADNISSFNSLARWHKEISMYLTSNTLIYLVETKRDLNNAISDQQIQEFSNSFRNVQHFRVSGLNKDHVLNMFGQILERVEEVRDVNRSQRIGTTMKESSASPERRSSTIRDVRYSDKKEKVVLMEGSYVKRLTVVDESVPGIERSVKLGQKNIQEDVGLEKPEDIDGLN